MKSAFHHTYQTLTIRSAITMIWLALFVTVTWGLFNDLWQLDMRFFWVAGNMWLDGASPYPIEDFRKVASEHFSSVPDVFIFAYPPHTLPVLSALGFMEPKQAAIAFYSVNIALIIFCAHYLTKITNLITDKLHPAIVYAAMLMMTSLLYHPTLTAVVSSQISLVMAASLICFVYASLSGRSAFAAIGIFGLLLKPQFGLAFLLVSLAQKKLRPPAFVAVLASAIMAFIGLITIDPLKSVAGFIQNTSVYGDSIWNISANSAGLGFLLSFLQADISTLTTIAAAMTAALFGVRYLSVQSHPPMQKLAGFLIMTIIVVFGSPNHSYDFVMFFIAMPLVLCAPSLTIRVTLITALLFLAQATPFILSSSDLELTQKLYVISGVYTAASALLSLAALMIVTQSDKPFALAVTRRQVKHSPKAIYTA